MICNFGDVIVLIEIDECDSNLCGNGGTCNDYINEFNVLVDMREHSVKQVI